MNMNPSRLNDISDELADNLTTKTELSIRLNNQHRDLEARQLALAPPEGWAGKNAEDRKLSEQRAFSADPTRQAIQEEINSLEEEVTRLGTVVETLTNERRAIEWIIRSRLVDALLVRIISPQHDHTHAVEDTAFDDYVDDVGDNRLTEKFGENGHFEDEPVGVAEEDSIPY